MAGRKEGREEEKKEGRKEGIKEKVNLFLKMENCEKSTSPWKTHQ